jgi:hypothetical protein
MKNTKSYSKGVSQSENNGWLFIVLTIFHYLSGLIAICLAIGFATAEDPGSQKLAGILSVFCVLTFALTQPDMKFKRIDTGWRFLDEMIN